MEVLWCCPTRTALRTGPPSVQPGMEGYHGITTIDVRKVTSSISIFHVESLCCLVVEGPAQSARTLAEEEEPCSSQLSSEFSLPERFNHPRYNTRMRHLPFVLCPGACALHFDKPYKVRVMPSGR